MNYFKGKRSIPEKQVKRLNLYKNGGLVTGFVFCHLSEEVEKKDIQKTQ